MDHRAACTESYLKGGKRRVSGSADNMIRIWGVEARQEMNGIPGHEGDVYAVSVFSNRQRIASASKDKTIRIWDLKTGKRDVLKKHQGDVLGLAILPDSQHTASASEDTKIRIWDGADGKQLKLFAGHLRCRDRGRPSHSDWLKGSFEKGVGRRN